MQVISFGKLTDILGNEPLEINAISSTDDLMDYLKTTFPLLQNETFVMAVNNQIVQQTSILQPNDTIALMPPFSGG